MSGKQLSGWFGYADELGRGAGVNLAKVVRYELVLHAPEGEVEYVHLVLEGGEQIAILDNEDVCALVARIEQLYEPD